MASRFWLFTEFDTEKVNTFKDWFKELHDAEKVQYIVGQKERCPRTDREHIQGYVIFEKRRRLNGVKEALGSTTIHLDQRRGNHKQAVEYCTKQDTRSEEGIELGEFSDSGPQSKALEEIRDKIKRGISEMEIAEQHFGLWCRYYQAFSKFRLLGSQPRDFKSEVRIYWGPPGTGKSRRATSESRGVAYRKPLGEWWDGYDGESDVIIDDFYGWIRFDELLRCLDRYSHRVPVKGGFVNFAPKRIFITSNAEPRSWYSVEKIDDYRFAALTRRIDHIEHMITNWEPEDQSD